MAALRVVVSFGLLPARASTIKARSPDRVVVVTIQPGKRLQYCVTFHGDAVVEPSALGVTVNGNDLGRNVSVAGGAEASAFKEEYKI